MLEWRLKCVCFGSAFGDVLLPRQQVPPLYVTSRIRGRGMANTLGLHSVADGNAETSRMS